MQAVLELQSAPASESLLARARVHRKLTLEEAAARAGISEDAVRWLTLLEIPLFIGGVPLPEAAVDLYPTHSPSRVLLESGDWEAFSRWFTDGAEVRFEGAPVGPFRSRDEIRAAYESRPPDEEVAIA